MASVRLHHPRLASCTYVVELPQSMPEAHSRECFTCKQVHARKALHLRLDDRGDVFVAEGILALLRTVPTMGGLEVHDGRNAPPQFVGALELPTQHIILPHGEKYVPGFNKYEAGERMQRPFQPLADAMAEWKDRNETAKRAEKATTFILGRRK
jgi:hypothetical protein